MATNDSAARGQRFESTWPSEAVSNSSVRIELKQVLASRTFANAPSLTRLLEYVVEQTLDGHGDRLKEYSLGVDVFRRGPSFDPRTETIVRVQARRLRDKLNDYFANEGRSDPLVIELPKGHYVPAFRPRVTPNLPPPHGMLEAPSPTDSPFTTASSGVPAAFRLPAPRTSFVGRARELAAIGALLHRDDVRLVTLTGVGGSGKTRLAVQAAAQAWDGFHGGVLFVGLTGLSEAVGVAPMLAQAFRLRQTDARPLVEALQDHVHAAVREPTLLVVDNFEHLLPAAAVLSALLDASLQLKMLVTSRERLRLYGEHCLEVPPLPLPDRTHIASLSRLAQNPAVALFAIRATAVQHDFELTIDNAPAVAGICHRLEGLPLGIELAAAQVRTFSPAAMVTRLEQRLLNVPAGGYRDVPLRQQTLRDTLDWSYELLTADQQQLFRRLAVFAGGCTVGGVEAVCNAFADLGCEVDDGLSVLVDKCLLQRFPRGDDEPRFGMIEIVREYGLERLAASGEQEPVRRAHAAYCLVLAEEGDAAAGPAERSEWFRTCEVEQHNFRTALDYVIDRELAEWAQRLAVALHAFWDRQHALAEARARFAAILTLGGPEARRSPAWAKAACYAAGLASVQAGYDAMFGLHRGALEVYRELGDARGMITALTGMGYAERGRGDKSAALRYCEQALEASKGLGDGWRTAAAMSNLASALDAMGDHARACALLHEAEGLFRALGDRSGVAWSLNHRGNIARERGALVEARRAYLEGLDTFRQLSDEWGTARSCADLGYLACEQHDYAAAYDWLCDALRICRTLEHGRGVIHVLEGFAVLAARQGHAERALTLGGAAAALRRAVSAPPIGRVHAQVDEALDRAWNQQDAAQSRGWWAAGTLLPLEEVIQLAVEGGPGSRAPHRLEARAAR